MKITTNYFAAIIMALIVLFMTGMTVYASGMDDRIESAARNSHVFKTYLSADDIKIKSVDGVVTLNGTVSEEFHKSLARDTVLGLPGVKSVDNNLQVKSFPIAANPDERLAAKVKAKLLSHRSVLSGKTDVSVKDSIVTLTGEADNQAQKELTTVYAKDVEGVKDVNNEMTVSKISNKTVNRVLGKIDDASITAQAKMSLLLHRSTSIRNTRVITNNGVVTLEGVAENAAEKELVTKLVRDIDGVKSVTNRMTIE